MLTWTTKEILDSAEMIAKWYWVVVPNLKSAKSQLSRNLLKFLSLLLPTANTQDGEAKHQLLVTQHDDDV